eukprot:scaffold64876_cov36-Phaeocystis_antarctica.AAC.1
MSWRRASSLRGAPPGLVVVSDASTAPTAISTPGTHRLARSRRRAAAPWSSSMRTRQRKVR